MYSFLSALCFHPTRVKVDKVQLKSKLQVALPRIRYFLAQADTCTSSTCSRNSKKPTARIVGLFVGLVIAGNLQKRRLRVTTSSRAATSLPRCSLAVDCDTRAQ